MSRANENLETCIPVRSEQLKEPKWFWAAFTGHYFNKWTLYQKCKISCSVKTSTYCHSIFARLSSAKQLPEKFHFEFLQAFSFSSTWNKKTSSCRSNTVTFRHNNAYMHCVKIVRIPSYSGPHFSHIFPHSDWIRRDTEYLSIFSPNVGKCGKNADQNNSGYAYFLRSDG